MTDVTDLTIRPLAPADISGLAAMLGGMEPWTYYGVDAAAWERILRSIPPEELAFVAEQNGEVVGYVQFRLGGTFALSGYIRTLAVQPGQAGQGLGRRILAFAEEMILAKGPNVFLLCSTRNEAAQRFYAAVGYAEAGRLEAFVLPGEDEIIYRKTTGPIRRST
jgi:ribosomal protein S18 acetylase RimI-like enzyme